MLIDGNLLIKNIRSRLYHKNKNCFVLCQGDTGSGKSESIGLSLCKAVDPTFNLKRIAYAKATPFMQILNSPDLKKGMAVMWDDAGLGMAARDFNKLMNKALSRVLQVFRTDNLLIVVTVPDLSMIDKHMRLLYHFQIDSLKIDYENKHAIAKVYQIQNNRKLKKIYYKFLRTRKPNGKIVVASHFRFARAPLKLRNEYNKWRKELTAETKREALDIVTKAEMFEDKKEKQKIEKANRPRCKKCSSISLYFVKTRNCLTCRECGTDNEIKEESKLEKAGIK